MAKRKQGNALYAFLNQEGVLATGDERLIQEAKRKYWTQYKKEWRKLKRQQNKSITIYLSTKEHSSIRKAADVQSTSPTAFTKLAVMSLAGKDSLIDSVLLGKMREYFALCVTDVEDIIIRSGIPLPLEEAILNRMEQMEDQVLNLIAHPKPKR